MKKYLLFLAAIAAAAMMQTRCSQFQVELDNPATEAPAVATGMVAMSFSAAFDPDEAFTKTELGTDADSKKVPTWKQGDEIAIFASFPDSTSAGPYIFTATSDGQTTDFQGTVPDGANAYYAVYPATAAQSIAISSNGNGGLFAAVASVVIPCEQEAVAGSFDPNAMLSAAMNVSADSKLYFRSVGALLRFQVSRDDIVAVRFSSAKNMSGSISATIRNQSSYLSVAEDGTGTLNKEVFVKAPAGTTFEAGKDYYAVIRARSDHASFAAEMLTEDYLLGAKRANSTLSISRAHILPLGTLDSNPTEAFIKDNYTAFQWGYDVEIGGQIYNKASQRPAYAKSTSDNGGNIRSYLNSTEDAIYFLDNGETYTCGSVSMTKNIVLCPRRDGTVSVTTNSNTWNLQNGSLVVKGIDFSSALQNFLSNASATGNVSNLVFTDCSFTLGYVETGKTANLFVPNNTSGKNNIIENAVFDNCSFALAGDTKIININSSNVQAQFKSLRFVNNLVYCKTDATTCNMDVLQAATTAAADVTYATALELSRNLFVNAVSEGGMLKYAKVDTLTVKDNIQFETNDHTISSNQTKLFTLDSSQDVSVFTLSNNLASGLADGKKWTYSASTVATNMYNQLGINNTLPSANGVFSSGPSLSGGVLSYTLASGYEGIGPQ